jgi:hypothetical protein
MRMALILPFGTASPAFLSFGIVSPVFLVTIPNSKNRRLANRPNKRHLAQFLWTPPARPLPRPALFPEEAGHGRAEEFGQAATKIAPHFIMSRWTATGLAADGAHVKAPIRMVYDGTAAGPGPAPTAR